MSYKEHLTAAFPQYAGILNESDFKNTLIDVINTISSLVKVRYFAGSINGIELTKNDFILHINFDPNPHFPLKTLTSSISSELAISTGLCMESNAVLFVEPTIWKDGPHFSIIPAFERYQCVFFSRFIPKYQVQDAPTFAIPVIDYTCDVNRSILSTLKFDTSSTAPNKKRGSSNRRKEREVHKVPRMLGIDLTPQNNTFDPNEDVPLEPLTEDVEIVGLRPLRSVSRREQQVRKTMGQPMSTKLPALPKTMPLSSMPTLPISATRKHRAPSMNTPMMSTIPPPPSNFVFTGVPTSSPAVPSAISQISYGQVLPSQKTALKPSSTIPEFFDDDDDDDDFVPQSLSSKSNTGVFASNYNEGHFYFASKIEPEERRRGHVENLSQATLFSEVEPSNAFLGDSFVVSDNEVIFEPENSKSTVDERTLSDALAVSDEEGLFNW
ncbi:hypothetical protein PCE1_003665 [Barthelona sp. PCE]